MQPHFYLLWWDYYKIRDFVDINAHSITVCNFIFHFFPCLCFFFFPCYSFDITTDIFNICKLTTKLVLGWMIYLNKMSLIIVNILHFMKNSLHEIFTYFRLQLISLHEIFTGHTLFLYISIMKSLFTAWNFHWFSLTMKIANISCSK